MISIRNLRYRTLDIPALEIEPGLTTVIGENGSGKTTFMNLCAGFARDYQGDIYITGRKPGENRTGYVGEFPEKTIIFQQVYEELASPLRFSFMEEDEIAGKVRGLSETLGIAHLLDKKTDELSGGEKTIVSLATAMIYEPEILVLDEFDSHLDSYTVSKCRMILGHCGADYILHCTQNTDLCTGSRTVLFFSGGRIIHAGSPEEVFGMLEGTCFYPIKWRFGYEDRSEM